MISDSAEGPFSDDALLQICFDGKISPKTLVAHPTKTKSQWVAMERLPAAKKKFEEGELYRQEQRDEKRRQKEEQRQLAAQAAEEKRQAAAQVAAEQRARLPFIGFLTDGQNEATVTRIYERVQQILTSNETIEYMAVQAKPVAIAADCAVATNRRFIVFHQKMLGRADFEDYLWRDLADARVKEGMMFATVTFRAMNGQIVSVDYLPKVQARRIYRIAQEREEKAVEERRNREMEEKRAAAGNIVVNAPALSATPTPSPPVAANSDDPVAKLTKLKDMLDAGLISADEYNATKSRILQGL